MNRVLTRNLLPVFLSVLIGACASGGGVTGGAQAPLTGGAEPQRASADTPVASPAQRSARVHVELGTAYMQSGRNGVALDEARAAIASDPGYAPGYALMGLVYADQEQYALAGPAFEQAARTAPGDPEIANAHGWFLCSQGRVDEGLARLEQAARNPYYATPTRAWTNAGLCLARKDEPGAESRFERAVQADATNVQALVYLAQIAQKRGHDLRAKQWVDQALKYPQGNNAAVIWLAARIEQRLGNRGSVQELGARLRRDFPGSNEYQYFIQGKFE
ncbi:MAG: type IV pilus biogenesis/stability protein PilW [Candidatus Dactylopiibacterium sp.]|nr:type IV pilus biogenesis/stability protein PilW [Candidatus Dactylopiibacterium sp.]